MTIKNDAIKEETIHMLSYYSKYYCRQFIECENLFNNEKGHFALFSFLALFENIIKSGLNDFESNFYNLNLNLKDKNLINDQELNFLNNPTIGVRKIRNILAHANLSKYDLVFEDSEVAFPFTENETCLILYDRLSTILSGIILKVLSNFLFANFDLDFNNLIVELNYKFVTRTPEELMAFKGISLSDNWNSIDEATKYRLVENSSDVNVLVEIIRNLKL